MFLQVIVVSFLQSANAYFSILVTLLGITIEVRALPANAASLMQVTPLGMETEVIPQFIKAHSPILVTLLGIIVVEHPAIR